MVRVELQLRLPNSPGALAAVAQLLADERVNIIAMTLAAGGHLHLVTDNPIRAAQALRGAHHKVDERDVIFTPLPNSPGALAPILSLVSAAGINIDYAYAAGLEGTATAALVIGVDDAQRVAATTGL